jgi:hypothetical protein
MRRRTVTINWSYPVSLCDDLEHRLIDDNGIYCIYRKFGSNNKLIYIGKTYDSFRHRLKSHKKIWLSNKRGKMSVRFGIVEKPNTDRLDFEQYKKLLEDIESALIFRYKPEENLRKGDSYKYQSGYFLFIQNKGYRGDLDSTVDAKKQADPQCL